MDRSRDPFVVDFRGPLRRLEVRPADEHPDAEEDAPDADDHRGANAVPLLFRAVEPDADAAAPTVLRPDSPPRVPAAVEDEPHADGDGDEWYQDVSQLGPARVASTSSP